MRKVLFLFALFTKPGAVGNFATYKKVKGCLKKTIKTNRKEEKW
jgi:hypothetical protein